MKRLSYITLIVFLMFVGINSASAKNVEKECLYQSFGKTNPDVGLEGNIVTIGDNEVTLRIYDNGSANAKITVARGTKKNQTVKVANWNNKKNDYTGSCFSYLMVEYDWGNTVYVSNSENELKEIANQKKWKLGDKAFIIAGKERPISDDEKKAALEYVNNATSYLNGLDLTVSSCRKENDLTPCRNLYKDVNNKLGEYKAAILNYVSSGVLTYEEVKNLDKLITEVTDKLSKFNDEIKKVQKEIDIEEQNPNPTPTPTPNPVDPEYKYGCEIFGDTLIEIIHEVYGYFKWIIPVLVVILSILDFIKVVGTGKDDDFKKAQNNLVKRVVLAIVFFLVPALISFIINFSGITEQFTNGDSIIEAVTCILG